MVDRGEPAGGTENSIANTETGNHLVPRALEIPVSIWTARQEPFLKSVSRGPSEGWPSTLVPGSKRESDKKEKV